jgi:hypothetical protein
MTLAFLCVIRVRSGISIACPVIESSNFFHASTVTQFRDPGRCRHVAQAVLIGRISADASPGLLPHDALRLLLLHQPLAPAL